MKPLFFGVDIGGTKIAVSAGITGKEEFVILQKYSFPTIPGGYQENLEKIIQLLKLLRDSYGKAVGIGIACGGPLDPGAGVIQSPPNLLGWEAVPIVEILEDRIGIPGKLENDADACALAEFRYGAGKGMDHMIFLTFGTGLGAGLILNGQLYRGATHCAGEVGHIRLSDNGPVGFGKEGSFEGYCSGGGIPQLEQMVLEERMGNWKESQGTRTAKEIFASAERGEPVALEVIRRCGNRLGQGLAILVDLLNPDGIVLGSIYVKGGDLLYPHMMKTLREEALEKNRSHCRILPAKLGDTLGDVASLSIAVEAYEAKEAKG